MLDFALGAKAKASGGGGDAELLANGQRHYLMVQRPEGGLLAGLWEFPGALHMAVAVAMA